MEFAPSIVGDEFHFSNSTTIWRNGIHLRQLKARLSGWVIAGQMIKVVTPYRISQIFIRGRGQRLVGKAGWLIALPTASFAGRIRLILSMKTAMQTTKRLRETFWAVRSLPGSKCLTLITRDKDNARHTQAVLCQIIF